MIGRLRVMLPKHSRRACVIQEAPAATCPPCSALLCLLILGGAGRPRAMRADGSQVGRQVAGQVTAGSSLSWPMEL